MDVSALNARGTGAATTGVGFIGVSCAGSLFCAAGGAVLVSEFADAEWLAGMEQLVFCGGGCPVDGGLDWVTMCQGWPRSREGTKCERYFDVPWYNASRTLSRGGCAWRGRRCDDPSLDVLCNYYSTWSSRWRAMWKTRSTVQGSDERLVTMSAKSQDPGHSTTNNDMLRNSNVWSRLSSLDLERVLDLTKVVQWC